MSGWGRPAAREAAPRRRPPWKRIAWRRRGRRWIVAIAVGVGLIGAEYLAYGVAIPRLPGRAEAAPRAAFAAPPVVLAPAGGVPGLHLEAVLANTGAPRDRMTVYGRPGDPTFARGRLMAIYHEGSDAYALPELAGARPVLVNAHPGRVGRAGEATWVTWSVWFDGDQETDQYAVIGRGVAEPEVIHAARHLVTPDGNHPLIDRGGLPGGFAPVAAGDVDTLRGGAFAAGGTTLRWTDRKTGTALELTAIGVDDRAAALAYALVGGEARTIRGAPGLAGAPIAAGVRAEPARARVWRDKDTAYVLTAYGVPDDRIDAVVAALRPVNAKALDALRRTVADYPPERLVPAGFTVVASGRLDAGVWVVSRDGAARPSEDVTILLHTGQTAGSSGSPQQFNGPMAVSANGLGPVTVLIGQIRPPAAAVRVVAGPDGKPVVPRIGPKTKDGTRWFGVAVPSPEGPVQITVTAFDALGRVVATEKR